MSNVCSVPGRLVLQIKSKAFLPYHTHDQPVLQNAQHHNNKNTPFRLSLIAHRYISEFETAGPADGTSSGCWATEGRGYTHRSSHPGCRWCWWCCCATHPRKPQAAPLYSAILAGPLQLTLRFIRREESLCLLQEPLRLVRLVAGQRRRGDVDAPLRLVPVDFHCGGTGAAAHWTRSK